MKFKSCKLLLHINTASPRETATFCLILFSPSHFPFQPLILHFNLVKRLPLSLPNFPGETFLDVLQETSQTVNAMCMSKIDSCPGQLDGLRGEGLKYQSCLWVVCWGLRNGKSNFYFGSFIKSWCEIGS